MTRVGNTPPDVRTRRDSVVGISEVTIERISLIRRADKGGNGKRRRQAVDRVAVKVEVGSHGLDPIIQGLLLDERQDLDVDRIAIETNAAAGHPPHLTIARKGVERVVVIMQGQAPLFQIVRALAAASRLARRLDSRKQQRDQDPDNRDHHQELNQSKATSLAFADETNRHKNLLV